ncbi:hypothetical protein NDU88_002198 [Pleurodeles waltl]|uniref:Uncharacterized protein n=1 Tax=Pleurodeles waltl TaxID=8319 RepID=A0AAV7KRG5_PLEWA|nr:hypothetical protein NDU88_002198 [Pleurodeles waltl]
MDHKRTLTSVEDTPVHDQLLVILALGHRARKDGCEGAPLVVPLSSPRSVWFSRATFLLLLIKLCTDSTSSGQRTNIAAPGGAQAEL